MAERTWWEFSAVKDEEVETRKGPWTVQEDMKLIRYISLHGEGCWSFLAKAAGLKRKGKSCRLRWINYLRPDLKRCKITPQEESLIVELHRSLGNRWSRIAQSLPGRTDNEIKNYWRTRMKRKMNLQAESSSSSSGMDADNKELLESSMCSHDYFTTSSQILPDLNSAEPSTRFTRQTTEEREFQTKKVAYLEADISPSSEKDFTNGLQDETRHGSCPINEEYGQQSAALQEDLEGSDEVFENGGLPYTFSVGSLATLLPFELFADDGTTQDPSYMVASPEAFTGCGSYWNCNSDVLWNMHDD